MTVKSTCRQCETRYEKGSWNSKYCTEDCRKDFLSKKTKAQSKYRQKNGELWPTVRVAQPVTVRVPATRPSKNKLKVSLILPDPQFGYRKVGKTLEPFHDEGAYV